MIEIIKENFSSIIGIVGIILGVILGAVLESFSRRGKIKLFQKSLNYSFQEKTNSGGFSSTNSIITSKTDNLSVSVGLEIFNTSSHSKKILREVEFEVRLKSESRRYKLFNPSYRTVSKWESKTFESLSINPKDILDYNLHFTAKNDLEEIIRSKWFIRYRNDKNKVCRFKLDKNKIPETTKNS